MNATNEIVLENETLSLENVFYLDGNGFQKFQDLFALFRRHPEINFYSRMLFTKRQQLIHALFSDKK